MDRERRAHPRKRVSTAVAFHDPGGAPLRGWLHDISRGGCFIASPSHLTFGEPIEFQLRLPDGHEPVVGKGRVAWVRAKSQRELPAGMGIQFVEVSAEFLVAIDGLSGTGPTLSRPHTVKGIAPAPPTSSPSFSPDVVLELLADMKVDAVEQVPAPPPRAAPPPAPPELPPQAPSPLGAMAPPPPIDLKRSPLSTRARKRLLVGGAAVAIVGVGGVVAVVASLAHRGSSAPLDAAAAPQPSQVETATTAVIAVVEPEAGASTPVDSGVADAGPTDAGRDGGRDAGRAQPKPKPKPKPHR